jgi:nicotinamidase/pyrazinamidase
MRALLVVDVQNDFMPFGALPVRDGDAVVPIANALAPVFPLVVASQDWHPADHASFASNHPGRQPGDVIEIAGESQVLWPDHCVQDLPGASFHSGLDVALIDHVVRKGSDRTIDSYSTFFDNGHRRETGLNDLLADRGVDEIYIVGLATDYCVRWSAHDARALGLKVAVVVEGVRAVDLAEGDGARALDEMREAGCRIVSAGDVY